MKKTQPRYWTKGPQPAQPASAGMVTLGTLVTLLAVAVVMDAQVDRRVVVVRSSYVLEACRESEGGEHERSNSIARKLVEAARDFLGTSVYPVAALDTAPRAWHVQLSPHLHAAVPNRHMTLRDLGLLLHHLNLPPPPQV